MLRLPNILNVTLSGVARGGGRSAPCGTLGGAAKLRNLRGGGFTKEAHMGEK